VTEVEAPPCFPPQSPHTGSLPELKLLDRNDLTTCFASVFTRPTTKLCGDLLDPKGLRGELEVSGFAQDSRDERHTKRHHFDGSE